MPHPPVVFESMFGNTEAIARAVADGSALVTSKQPVRRTPDRLMPRPGGGFGRASSGTTALTPQRAEERR